MRVSKGRFTHPRADCLVPSALLCMQLLSWPTHSSPARQSTTSRPAKSHRHHQPTLHPSAEPPPPPPFGPTSSTRRPSHNIHDTYPPTHPQSSPLTTMPQKSYQPAAGEHDLTFLAWCRSRGITFTSITPARFAHAGLGIASTAPIAGPNPVSAPGAGPHRKKAPAGETIAFTPKAALLTRENVALFAPRLAGRVGALLRELGTHACFAAAIAGEVRVLAGGVGEGNGWWPWMRVWPRLGEFAEGLPLLWGAEEQGLLPPSAISALDAQKSKFARDFEKVTRLGFDFTRDEYIYAWLIVNTRSLFYRPETPEYKELTREDCMALCPFIDYFNHSDDGCKVELTPHGYAVTASAGPLPADTQLFVTYGCHSNDFLLCEYGFVLPTPTNKWDEVTLDAHILPALTPAHRALLAAEGFLGGYAFDRAAVCFRTQAAVRLLLIRDPEHPRSRARVERWRRFVAGEEDGERERAQVEAWVAGVLAALRRRGRGAWRAAEGVGSASVRGLVQERWEQVLGMVESVGAVVGLEAEEAE